MTTDLDQALHYGLHRAVPKSAAAVLAVELSRIRQLITTATNHPDLDVALGAWLELRGLNGDALEAYGPGDVS